jgi:hypothetical protein
VPERSLESQRRAGREQKLQFAIDVLIFAPLLGVLLSINDKENVYRSNSGLFN